MRVYFAADHAGAALGEALASVLGAQGYDVTNLSAPGGAPGDDYPDAVRPLAEKVASENVQGEPAQVFGIALGASGQGESMVANRVQGVRAAVYYGEERAPQQDAAGEVLGIIESSRAHNDANILALGARFLSHEAAADAVRRFLATPFSGEERHVRRIAKF
jgi:ribose 5-phosphate isomerase B